MSKTIPVSVESEDACISCIFIDPQKSIPLCEELITEDHFHQPSRKALYSALCALHHKGGSLDLITTIGALQEARILDSVGGPAEIAKLQSLVPSALLLKSYLEILQDRYHKRQLLRANMALGDAVYGDQEELGEAVVGMEQAIEGWKTVQIKDDGLTTEGYIELIDELEARSELSRAGKTPGISTGIKALDNATRGLQKGKLYGIGAAPGVGKSLLLSQFAVAAADQGIKSAIFSVEMYAQGYRERTLVQHKAASSGEMTSGIFKQSSLPKITSSMGLLREYIYIDDTPVITVAQIIAKLKRHFIKHPDTGLVGIDYLQILRTRQATRKSGSREQEVSELVREVNSIKKLFSVPVVLITALNRKSEDRKDRRPRLADSRDSGQIEYELDVGMLLHFPEEGANKKEGTIILAKQRDGADEDVEVTFERQWLRFEQAAKY
jgi:replicative DNA helicase